VAVDVPHLSFFFLHCDAAIDFRYPGGEDGQLSLWHGAFLASRPATATFFRLISFSCNGPIYCPRSGGLKFLSLVEALGIAEPVYLVADAYYACHTMVLGLIQAGST